MRAETGPGSVVAGRYELLARIGQGATGTVWRARDQVLHRDVAVKEVRLPELMSERDRAVLRERTLREARVSAKLSHPAVVTVHDVIEVGGTPWIVMELATARSLHQVLAEDGPLPPDRVAEMGTMLLGALASAHAAGIVHRDVKPGNVLVTSDGRAVLTDFGIATVAGDPALTQTGVVVGTPGFCAPERIRGGPASPASDLWSLGATLYAAVEGRGPFDGDGSPMAVLASIVNSDPPPARSAGPLGTVIGALLSKDPAQRPAAARAGQLLADAAAALKATARTNLVPAGAVPAPAAASPVPAGGGRAAASARTDPIGFPASPPPTPAGQGAATAQLLAGAGPDLLTSAPGPFPPAPGPGLLPPLTGLGSFPRAARPALFPAPADVEPPLPVSLGTAPLPVSMGAAPLPDSTGTAAGAGATGPSGLSRPAAARSSPGWRWLVLGLAGAAIVVAGLAAGLMSSRVTGSSAPGNAASLPGGYRWYTRPPAAAGTARGFTLAVPAGWQPRQQGTVTYLWNPASGAIMSVFPAPADADGPTWDTRVLKRARLGQGTFASYRRIAGAPFPSRGKMAGAWRVSYRQPGTGAVAGLVVVTQANAAGGRSFELTATAPVRFWLPTRTAFAEAVRTFSPQA